MLAAWATSDALASTPSLAPTLRRPGTKVPCLPGRLGDYIPHVACCVAETQAFVGELIHQMTKHLKLLTDNGMHRMHREGCWHKRIVDEMHQLARPLLSHLRLHVCRGNLQEPVLSPRSTGRWSLENPLLHFMLKSPPPQAPFPALQLLLFLPPQRQAEVKAPLVAATPFSRCR